ncbi:hypothetical protein, partial [Bacteroides pyogenes]
HSDFLAFWRFQKPEKSPECFFNQAETTPLIMVIYYYYENTSKRFIRSSVRIRPGSEKLCLQNVPERRNCSEINPVWRQIRLKRWNGTSKPYRTQLRVTGKLLVKPYTQTG